MLSPSASAVVVGSVSEAQTKIGCITRMKEKERKYLDEHYKRASDNVTITSSTLSVKGNSTSLSVTMKNIGKSNATLQSLTLQGTFNATYSWAVKSRYSSGKGHGGMGENMPMMKEHPRAIPFKVTGGKLVPLFGDIWQNSKTPNMKTVLKPGESVTLTYNGVLGIFGDGKGRAPSIVVTPLKGESYTIHLMAPSDKPFTVTAVAG
jgi:hypothetical protein